MNLRVLGLLVCLLVPEALIAQPLTAARQASVHPAHFLESSALDGGKLLPPPPSSGSVAAQADLEAVVMAQAWRTPEQVAWAQEVDKDDPFASREVLGPWFQASRLPLCARFLADALEDVHPISSKAKQAFGRPRPYQADARVLPCVPKPTNSSYPSGHSLHAFVRALVLAEVFPEKRTALLERAHRAAWGRILGGVHFPSDDVAGRLLAEAIVTAMKANPAFMDEVKRCRKEAEPFLSR